MTSVEKKLLSLNLALLFLFLCAHPAFAAGTEHAEEFLQSEASVAMGETLQCHEQNEVAMQSASEDDPYYICVGENVFRSNQDASGDGWTYNAEWHELLLNGYQGSGISASGDLSIYVTDDTTIKGYGDTTYGDDGISVAGYLTLGIWSGSHLQVSGGYGSKYGGDAIYGRDCVDIYGGGFLTVTGGNSTIHGGNGIFSNSVYVATDGTVCGGDGTYGGAGIFFYNSCSFYLANETIIGGDGESGYAIASEDGRAWRYSEHMTIQVSQKKVILKVHEYTLRLFDENRRIFSKTAEYPMYYDLLDYRQEKEGFVQVGWQYRDVMDNAFLPINESFCPSTNTDLYAYWEPVGPRDILLQGLDGYFDNKRTYQKYTGIDVILPKQLNYSRSDDINLLAWSDQLQASALDLCVYDGIWYCGGDTVEAEADTAKVLYAYPQSGAGTAIYHPTKGTVKKGGTVIVQGRYSGIVSPMDLQTYTIGADYLTAPENYRLAGWSTSPEAETVDYELGEELQVDGGAVQHLYAVWEGREYTETPETGCTVTTIPAEAKVVVTLEKSWCIEKGVKQGFCALYDENGKLIDVSVGTQNGDQGITLEMQYMGETAKTCKVFGVKDQNIPTGQAIECTLLAIDLQ